MSTPPAVRSRRPLLRQHRVEEDAAAARRWPIRRWFALGAGAAAVIMVLAMVFGTVAVLRIADARDRLYDDVSPALSAAQDASSALLNQETGVRGFTIVRTPEFLAPYTDGVDAENRAMERFYQVLGPADAPVFGSADAVLRADADQLRATARAWRDEYAGPAIAAARGEGGTVDLQRGRELFDQVRARSAGLVGDLAQVRVDARGQLDGAIRYLGVVGVVIAVIAAGFLAGASFAVRGAMLRPISRLAAQTRAVVGGDVGEQVVQAVGPREIVELGQDVEAMRAHIQREVDSLQDANRRLDEQTRELERSNRDLEQFAYVASHDLQEPLRKVSSFCQLLQRRYGGRLDERADQYIGFAVDGAQRMQTLINDLLTFSRVGRTTEGFVAVPLAKVARAAAGQLEVAREEAGGEIVVPDDLPHVHGDAGLLQQLLFNLIGNALKFRRPGVPPVVRVEGGLVGDDWEIVVRDNGIGIEPEFADKIFVIFQRLHGREVYAGTGIGLALAKKIVEFHGGRIWVDTDPRPEPGTVVRFTLPVEAQTPAGRAAPATAKTESVREPSL
ncbi:MAG: ATP-binding protein [Pseudonocardia sp.]|nr:ATP-binding protein [Pseudonocardia sp.]